MFSCGLRKYLGRKLELPDISGAELQLIVHYCYTGQITITFDNIGIVLSAATRYEFTEIEKMCSDILKCHVEKNPKNCLSYYSLAHSFNLKDLKQFSKELVLKHFMELKDSDKFLLLDFDLLHELMKTDELIDASEKDIFNTATTWINYDKINRVKYVSDIAKVIRFDQIDLTVSHKLHWSV